MISLLQYQTKTEKTAKSVDEATKLALEELGIDEQDANITVISEGSKGFLGFGSKESAVSVEAKDPNAIVAKTFLSTVFDAMKLDVTVSAKSEDDSLNVEMSGEHMGLVIGKRGDTLDSLQYLTSLVVNHESTDRVRVVLDTENYREKRKTALTALATRLSEKVLNTGKKHTLEPMNPYERRIIHSCVQSIDGITTFSIGEEPYRKVVIAPERGSSYHNNSYKSESRPFARTTGTRRPQNRNKVKSYDEFLASASETEATDSEN